MKKDTFIEKLIDLFSDAAGGCSTQYNWSPCNTCFHAIENVDFQHITWLLILALRGDYNDILDTLLRKIREELEKVEK